MKRLTAYAPASLANLGAGFDVLGAALCLRDGGFLGNRVTLEESAAAHFEVSGPFAHRMPADPAGNLVLRARACFEEAIGRALPPLLIRLAATLPVSGGLGSSASSIVATLVALDAWCDGALGEDALLGLAGRLEGEGAGGIHLDNVAPCLRGGLRLTTGDGRSVGLPFPDGLVFVIALPELELPTRTARAALPAALSRGEAVDYGRNLAAFVHALHVGDRALLAASIRDPIAEPHRAPLVPGFAEAKAAALVAGALGVSFSGSGPATFALVEEADTARVARALVDGFARAGVRATTIDCVVDGEGARLL